MNGLTMLKINVHNSSLIRSLSQRLLVPTPSGGRPSVPLLSNGSVGVTGSLVHPGYITPPTPCPNPGLTPLVLTDHRCVNGFFIRRQSHLPGGMFIAGTACSPTSTSSPSSTRAILPPRQRPPQHRSSPEYGVPVLARKRLRGSID